MNKKLFISLFAFPLVLTACNGGGNGGGDSTSASDGSSGATSAQSTSGAAQSTSAPSSAPSQQTHTQDEVEEYMNALKGTSQGGHLYLHYYRYAQTAADYNKWDVWAWPYSPKPGEGHRFDWTGRTTAADRLSATGDATIDSFGYAVCNIDLTKKDYDGGWKAASKKMGGTTMDFYQLDSDELDEKIGLQVVDSDSRVNGGGFWVNDSGQIYVTLADCSLTNTDGTTSYHVFATQDKVQDFTTAPLTSNVDPFENDDGNNYTYGRSEYADVNFSVTPAKKATSPLFLNGDTSKPYLKYGAGVGYQIMVSSFADSDGDGMGDIYGITQKLDYLKELGVNVLWLTPIQMSDSYHGYDISDYTQVDPKFGSSESPNVGADGKPTADSAMKDYKDLIAAAHTKGMAVIMDLVLNHTSPTNKWFIKSAQLDPNYRGYYQWGNHTKDSSVIKEEKCWYPYGDHVYSYYAKFGSSMPELNYAYVSTRAAVATMAKQWCEIGVDGFRMDAVKHIFMNDEVKKDSGDTIVEDVTPKADYSSNLTKNLHFWRQLAKDVKDSYPNCFFVGENFDGNAYNVAPFYEGFDSLFDFYSYFNITTIAGKAVGNPKATGGPTSAHAFLAGSTDNKWDLKHVLAKNDEYRGQQSINGIFTSNHDIARTINRIHASASDMNGITAQGNVTTGDYAQYDKMALLTHIVEVLLPGCTWIYYGDELGMTGNFPAKDKEGATFTAESSYSDLYYRQPMKWKQNGVPGDESYTAGYGVTGSGINVGWDEVNATSTVKDAATQVASNSSHYSVLKEFVKLKNNTPALIKGTLESYAWGTNNWVFNFHRTLNGVDYAVVVNMGTNSLENGLAGDGYQLDAYYNSTSVTKTGTIPTSLAGRSALVCHKTVSQEVYI